LEDHPSNRINYTLLFLCRKDILNLVLFIYGGGKRPHPVNNGHKEE
jgi:hypothetical protein